jgi:hypothetical protein
VPRRGVTWEFKGKDFKGKDVEFQRKKMWNFKGKYCILIAIVAF